VTDYIIAVDPGRTCGWAMAHLSDGFKPDAIAAGQAHCDDFCSWANDNVGPSCLLVVEKFVITARTAQLSPQSEPMEVIGVLRFLARRAGAQFEMQTPSAAKKFASDAQLRKVGLWRPGQDHARDAIRHLLLAIATHGAGQARQEMLQSLA
jgi:hypothetical protein